MTAPASADTATGSAGPDDPVWGDLDDSYVETPVDELYVPPESDPDAPYGRKPDGTPYKTDPAPYRKRSERRSERHRSGRRRPTGPSGGTPPRKSSGPSSKSSGPSSGKSSATKRGEPDYRPGVTGLLALPVGLLSGLAVGLRNESLMADAATVASAAPALADAAQLAAEADPRAAAMLDWALTAGPYGAIASVVIGVGAQIAVNHGKLKPGLLGTREPADLMAEFVASRNGHAG